MILVRVLVVVGQYPHDGPTGTALDSARESGLFGPCPWPIWEPGDPTRPIATIESWVRPMTMPSIATRSWTRASALPWRAWRVMMLRRRWYLAIVVLVFVVVVVARRDWLDNRRRPQSKWIGHETHCGPLVVVVFVAMIRQVRRPDCCDWSSSNAQHRRRIVETTNARHSDRYARPLLSLWECGYRYHGWCRTRAN